MTNAYDPDMTASLSPQLPDSALKLRTGPQDPHTSSRENLLGTEMNKERWGCLCSSRHGSGRTVLLIPRRHVDPGATSLTMGHRDLASFCPSAGDAASW